ncbi:prepilin-type N-terminal cleavage/methylation domain-containing protein [bacterium]|nr:prepilin-type N-terminal cleavage/methylation domain-containing protein [candidate division CSSED10-310 bacterium]
MIIVGKAGTQSGFTLMEILVAVMVASMLGVGVAAGLSAALRAWESGEKNLELFQTKRIVCDRLITEIGNAVNVKGRKEDEEKYKMIFDGDTDTLAFLTTAQALISPGIPMALKESHIFVEPGMGLVIREAMFSSSEFFDTGRGEDYLLDPDVVDIKFAYYYIPRPSRAGSDQEDEDIEGEWLDAWGPEHIEIYETTEESGDGEGEASRTKQQEITMRLPLAVEVSITSLNPSTGQSVIWQPLIIPLKEARVLGVSVRRR